VNSLSVTCAFALDTSFLSVSYGSSSRKFGLLHEPRFLGRLPFRSVSSGGFRLPVRWLLSVRFDQKGFSIADYAARAPSLMLSPFSTLIAEKVCRSNKVTPDAALNRPCSVIALVVV